jgi:hypothetical protein
MRSKEWGGGCSTRSEGRDRAPPSGLRHGRWGSPTAHKKVKVALFMTLSRVASASDPVDMVERRRTEAAPVDVDDPTSSDERSSLASLLEDLARAEAAHRMMQAADICLRSGDDHLLQVLGFSVDHIADLRSRSEGPVAGYPAYALRNARQTMRWLRSRVVALSNRSVR